MMILMIFLLLSLDQIIMVVKCKHLFNDYKDYEQKISLKNFTDNHKNFLTNDLIEHSTTGYHNRSMFSRFGDSISASNLLQNIQKTLGILKSSNSNIQLKRRKRWSRVDDILERHNHSLETPRRSEIDKKRNTEIKIEAPILHKSKELFNSTFWKNNLLPEIIQGVMKEYDNQTGLFNLSDAGRSKSYKELRKYYAIINKIFKGGVGEFYDEDATTIIIPTMPFKRQGAPELRSAIDCDEWDDYYRTCYFDRNIGDTITFVLAFENFGPDDLVSINWKQMFYVKNSNITIPLSVSPEDSMWNIVVGSNNRELRISPLIETDFDFNMFVANAVIRFPSAEMTKPVTSTLNFKIRQMAIDMGFVYPGEHLILNIRSFMTLPHDCCTFEWFLDKKRNDKTLPSNMKVSYSGITVEISELRMEQEGILACSVFSNRNVFLTKKRFLIKEFKKSPFMNLFLNRRQEREASYQNLLFRKRNKRQVDETGENMEIAEGFKVDVEGKTTNAPNNGYMGGDVEQRRVRVDNNLPNAHEPDLQTNQPINSNMADGMNSQQRIPDKFRSLNLTDFGDEYIIETGKLNTKDKTEIRMSKMIADCISNRQCSDDATCYQENANSPNYCKCLPGYRGNGLFCWEEAIDYRHNSAPRDKESLNNLAFSSQYI